MDFQLTESQRALQDAARKYAREVVRPKAAHYDETSEFPKDLLSAAFELGLINMAIPSEYGGLGLSHLEQVMVCEELAWGCAGVATSLIANDLANLPIILHGTDDQKKRLLTPFTQKVKFSSFCLTEPGAGSDVAAMSTTARREGDHYVLNGSKCFITNGGYADQFTVFATVDKAKKHKGITCFVVEGRPQGLTTGKHENKMGQRASNTTTVTFDEVRVPVANRIGEEGQGFLVAMATLDNSRPLTASISVGIARAALEHSLDYSAQRQTFGKPIREHQGVQFMLADMAMNTHGARLLTYESAWVLDQGQRNTLQSSYAKCFAADMAMKVTTDAVQVYGGYGYMKEYPVEKLMRDAKLIQVYEGTSQVQRLVIAKELFK
ncbi:acyl-CoA dehydrogenase [Corallococcus sp. H22C18031201]|uniref:acyl-CoA dehydrogenase family protein n=1 Tax=Citreicoccus inhibens TaxID=2849499 RepID=UPI000E770438|nr:acyl-CoA dehydrogenase family protein [Citreicoccus inhibens]MBU8896144.1 acyl-CoA dehydrogenase family protein [Citreicoccus inhibens]RJS26004.1 acyl-CoA dehydrogenase [Corallococcus sp. H22C18031201]